MRFVGIFRIEIQNFIFSIDFHFTIFATKTSLKLKSKGRNRYRFFKLQRHPLRTTLHRHIVYGKMRNGLEIIKFSFIIREGKLAITQFDETVKLAYIIKHHLKIDPRMKIGK